MENTSTDRREFWCLLTLGNTWLTLMDDGCQSRGFHALAPAAGEGLCKTGLLEEEVDLVDKTETMVHYVEIQ